MDAIKLSKLISSKEKQRCGWDDTEVGRNITEKIFWALSERLGDESLSAPVYTNKKGFSMSQMNNACKYFFDKNSPNWNWQRFSGTAGLGEYERYVSDGGGCVSYSLSILEFVLLPFWMNNAQTVADAIKMKPSELYPDDMLQEMLCEDLCEYISYVTGVTDVSYEEIITDFREIYLYLLEVTENGVIPDRITKQLSIFGNEITVDEYVDYLSDVTVDFIFDTIDEDARVKLVLPFIEFLAYPDCLVRCDESECPSMWVFQYDHAATYLSWRKKMMIVPKADGVICALDQALHWIIKPLVEADTTNFWYFSVGDAIISVYITPDESLSGANPRFIIAKKIFDELFPVWKEKYMETIE